MVENRIMITVPDNLTIVSGAEIGLEAYKQCKGQIDDEAMKIKEHFSFDSDMSCIGSAEKAFRKYIETT